jgi:hypothetical protein
MGEDDLCKLTCHELLSSKTDICNGVLDSGLRHCMKLNLPKSSPADSSGRHHLRRILQIDVLKLADTPVRSGRRRQSSPDSGAVGGTTSVRGGTEGRR